jgi:hypothetical protein
MEGRGRGGAAHARAAWGVSPQIRLFLATAEQAARDAQRRTGKFSATEDQGATECRLRTESDSVCIRNELHSAPCTMHYAL